MARFKTQAEVDAEITRLIERAIFWEELRERAEFESTEYWDRHDRAIRYHERARKLMPKGS